MHILLLTPLFEVYMENFLCILIYFLVGVQIQRLNFSDGDVARQSIDDIEVRTTDDDVSEHVFVNNCENEFEAISSRDPLCTLSYLLQYWITTTGRQNINWLIFWMVLKLFLAINLFTFMMLAAMSNGIFHPLSVPLVGNVSLLFVCIYKGFNPFTYDYVEHVLLRFVKYLRAGRMYRR